MFDWRPREPFAHILKAGMVVSFHGGSMKPIHLATNLPSQSQPFMIFMSHGAGLGVFIVICHTCFCFSFGLGACWEETFLSAFFFLDPTQFHSRDELQSLWKSWFEKDLLMFDDIQIPKIHIYIIWRDRLCCVDRSAKSFGCTYLMMMMIIIIIGIIHYSLLMFGSLLLHVQCSSCFPEVLTQFRQQWSCFKATPLPKIVFDEHTIWCSTITPSSTYIIFSYIYTYIYTYCTSFSHT